MAQNDHGLRLEDASSPPSDVLIRRGQHAGSGRFLITRQHIMQRSAVGGKAKENDDRSRVRASTLFVWIGMCAGSLSLGQRAKQRGKHVALLISSRMSLSFLSGSIQR